MISAIVVGILIAWFLINLFEVGFALLLSAMDGTLTSDPSPLGRYAPPPPTFTPLPVDPDVVRCSPSLRSPEQQAEVDRLIAKLREGL